MTLKESINYICNQYKSLNWLIILIIIHLLKKKKNVFQCTIFNNNQKDYLVNS